MERILKLQKLETESFRDSIQSITAIKLKCIHWITESQRDKQMKMWWHAQTHTKQGLCLSIIQLMVLCLSSSLGGELGGAEKIWNNVRRVWIQRTFPRQHSQKTNCNSIVFSRQPLYILQIQLDWLVHNTVRNLLEWHQLQSARANIPNLQCKWRPKSGKCECKFAFMNSCIRSGRRIARLLYSPCRRRHSILLFSFNLSGTKLLSWRCVRCLLLQPCLWELTSGYYRHQTHCQLL